MPHIRNDLFQQSNEEPHDEVSQMMVECKNLAREIKRDRPNRRSLPAGLYRTFPTRQVIDQLVQLYFTTTETCYPILHYPTFMTEYRANIDALEGANGSFLVELLLLMSVTGMMYSDDDVRQELGSRTPTWLHISQTWLSAPMEKDRLTIKGIQVHCLLLLARQVNRIGADIVWISAGSLIRMAMQMGLHQDPNHIGDMSTGQKELRRQLWYTILEMNVQAARLGNDTYDNSCGLQHTPAVWPELRHQFKNKARSVGTNTHHCSASTILSALIGRISLSQNTSRHCH